LQTVVALGQQTERITLAQGNLADGEQMITDEALEAVAVVLTGTLRTSAAGADLGRVSDGSSVFERPAEAVYAPGWTAITVPAEGSAQLAAPAIPLDIGMEHTSEVGLGRLVERLL
jgi:5-deoxy-D-glucuronate isomerase